MDRTVVSSDRSLGAVMRFRVALEAQGMGADQFPPPARPGQPRLEVIDRLALGPKHSLHLVRLADRTLLVGLSPQGCSLLESGPSVTLPAAPMES